MNKKIRSYLHLFLLFLFHSLCRDEFLIHIIFYLLKSFNHFLQGRPVSERFPQFLLVSKTKKNPLSFFSLFLSFVFFFLPFFSVPHGWWDFSSVTRDWTQAIAVKASMLEPPKQTHEALFLLLVINRFQNPYFIGKTVETQIKL